MSRIISVVFVVLMLLATVPDLSAENYINWRGGFWFSVPDDWEKIDYRLVDRFLSFTDTSQDVFEYEAVYAPKSSPMFAADAYLVVTFDSTGFLSKAETDSVLASIADSYSTAVFDAPIVQLMSDLEPGKPKINRGNKTVSVLSELAYRPDAMKKLWLYMQLNDRGLISLYFYTPDSTYQQNKPIFDAIVTSLSFENLKEAAEGEKLVFTSIGGDSLADPEAGTDATGTEGAAATEGISNIKDIILYAVIIIIAFGLIWNFIIAPRMKKKATPSE
jgi:hypothetical protein